MPFNAPGILSADEVYAVTAYILAEANIIDSNHRLGPADFAKGSNAEPRWLHSRSASGTVQVSASPRLCVQWLDAHASGVAGASDRECGAMRG
jgi:hypothetical protein